MLLDCKAHAYVVPHRKIAKARHLAEHLLRLRAVKRRLVGRLLLQSVVGYFQSLCIGLPYGRFYLSNLYACIARCSRPSVPLSKAAAGDLAFFWKSLQNMAHSRPWGRPTQTVVLCTDACASGWGAWMSLGAGVIRYAQGRWESSDRAIVPSEHSTMTELRAVRAALSRT